MSEAPTLPLTRQEREELNALSTEAYGKRLQWQKMLNKGEYRPVITTTKNGDPMAVNRLHHFTLQEIYDNMVKVIGDRKAEALKVAAEKEKDVTPTTPVP